MKLGISSASYFEYTFFLQIKKVNYNSAFLPIYRNKKNKKCLNRYNVDERNYITLVWYQSLH